MKPIKQMLMAALAGGSIAFGANAQALTPDDYCSPSITSPEGVKKMTPLNDGVTYAAISEDGRSIEVFSYKTGQKISTLF